MKPRMFVGSSSERLDLAYALQEGLESYVEPTVWTQGVFALSKTSLASLLDQLDESDLGAFIFAPDDLTVIRRSAVATIRDNVIFELGLFIGRLGPEKCFIIVPRGIEDLHLPSDLLGLTTATYDADRQDRNLGAALGPSCNRIHKALQKLSFERNSDAAAVSIDDASDVSITDPGDCIALLQSWMGSRPVGENRQAIRYREVDRQLKLAPGSTKEHIEEVASRWGYRVAQKGSEVILFEEII